MLAHGRLGIEPSCKISGFALFGGEDARRTNRKILGHAR
jgi:hypothetical protein